MNLRKCLLPVLLVLLLAACSEPLPTDKYNYAGEWRGEAVYLLITMDGSVSYKRLKGGVTTTINAPLKRFDGDNFEVGVGPMTTTFVVSKAPYQDEGRWKMVVDGVELSRPARTPQQNI